ncbi:MAG TPA: DedA family protein [Gemmatimonadales bacterium]|nr:DedA family protein [Gemmatimonadales bacterium]
MDRPGRGRRGNRRGVARRASLRDFLAYLEGLPPGPLYGLIIVLAAVENVVPPVPADTAVALGALLAGRGVLDAWTVFAVTWGANFTSASAVYWLARRYGAPFFRGRTGRRLLPESVLAHLEAEYRRHGAYGIFLSRLLPVWRAVVPPFAGVAGLSAPQALIPLALASALWYGALTFFVATLGTNLDAVVKALGRVNGVLGAVAVLALIFGVLFVRRRLKR